MLEQTPELEAPQPDYWTLMLSIANGLGVTLDTLPTAPYLAAPAQRRDAGADTPHPEQDACRPEQCVANGKARDGEPDEHHPDTNIRGPDHGQPAVEGSDPGTDEHHSDADERGSDHGHAAVEGSDPSAGE